MAATPPSIAVYERTIGASIDRIWENVLDWEHLPWLHRESFTSVRLESQDPEGWKATVELPIAPGETADIEVRLDRAKRRYVTATVGGVGEGSAIITELSPLSDAATDIRVDFRVPGFSGDSARAFGAYYTELYALLWDQDETMMQRRQQLLDAGWPLRSDDVDDGDCLGLWETLARSLPLDLRWRGRRVSLVAADGGALAFTSECPHLGGPLDAHGIEDGCVTCPWHGYRFDIATGRSTDGRRLRLAAVGRVRIDAASGLAYLDLRR